AWISVSGGGPVPPPSASGPSRRSFRVGQGGQNCVGDGRVAAMYRERDGFRIRSLVGNGGVVAQQQRVDTRVEQLDLGFICAEQISECAYHDKAFRHVALSSTGVWGPWQGPFARVLPDRYPTSTKGVACTLGEVFAVP